MLKRENRTKKGFTIIEVVLVLAIAGLIFLMVFIALPQLQKSQRDTQRRNDIARVVTALTQYQTNNNGKLPISKGYVTCDSDKAANIKPNDASTYSTDSSRSGTNKGACKFIATYLNSSSSATNEFVDPDGTAYAIYFDTGTGGTVTSVWDGGNVNHWIYVDFKAKCQDSTTTVTSSNPRDFAVTYNLEGSGSYCVDNQ